MNPKIIALLLIAGIGCIGFGLLAAPSMDQYVVEDVRQAAILDESETNVTMCTIKSFHLERHQKLSLSLFVYINESSTTDDTFQLKIVSWLTWNASQNADPSTVTGESYRYAAIAYPPTSITYASSTNFAWVEGTYYAIEFNGETPSMTKPLPGDYNIIIYNEDSSTYDNTTLYYDLTIKLDGLGPTLTMTFSIIGVVLLGLGAVLGIISRRR